MLMFFNISASYAQAPLTLPVAQMLVLDWDNLRSLDSNPEFHPNDAVLVVDPSFFTPQQRAALTPVVNGYYSFADEDALGQFDTNHDGIINSLDPIYSHLFLVYLADGSTQKIVSIKNAGIVTIELPSFNDPDRPTQFINKQDIHQNQAKALLSTGTMIYFHKVINTNG